MLQQDTLEILTRLQQQRRQSAGQASKQAVSMTDNVTDDIILNI